LPGLGEPAAQPFDAGVGGRPSEQRAGLGVVGEQPLDLAVLGPQPLGIGPDVHALAHQLGDQPHEVADRDLEAAADVDHLAHRLVGLRHGDEATDGVAHVVEVARRMQRAQPQLAGAGALARVRYAEHEVKG